MMNVFLVYRRISNRLAVSAAYCKSLVFGGHFFIWRYWRFKQNNAKILDRDIQ